MVASVDGIIMTDLDFKQLIALSEVEPSYRELANIEFNKFLAKRKLLGLDSNMVIEGLDVVMHVRDGAHFELTVPDEVDVVEFDDFSCSDIESLRLGRDTRVVRDTGRSGWLQLTKLVLNNAVEELLIENLFSSVEADSLVLPDSVKVVARGFCGGNAS